MAIQTITYDDKVALNENPSVAEINKVTDDNMNEIKSVVNNNASETSTNTTNITTNTTKITNLQTYSTSETNTGQTWINNKPIYRKVFSFTTPAGNTDYTINTGVSMDYIIKIYGGIRETSGGITPIPAAIDWGGTIFATSFRVSNNVIYYRGNSAYGEKPAYAILEYTKTTD
jgi:hypothetical protein